mmetsp:Transcript_18322/g.31010  ORF Transcript_18322/g.31010 Transcript_18322/m.31010 type:complete len:293 (-) Transcript_18322:89-967(-)
MPRPACARAASLSAEPIWWVALRTCCLGSWCSSSSMRMMPDWAHRAAASGTPGCLGKDLARARRAKVKEKRKEKGKMKRKVKKVKSQTVLQQGLPRLPRLGPRGRKEMPEKVAARCLRAKPKVKMGKITKARVKGKMAEEMAKERMEKAKTAKAKARVAEAMAVKVCPAMSTWGLIPPGKVEKLIQVCGRADRQFLVPCQALLPIFQQRCREACNHPCLRRCLEWEALVPQCLVLWRAASWACRICRVWACKISTACKDCNSCKWACKIPLLPHTSSKVNRAKGWVLPTQPP